MREVLKYPAEILFCNAHAANTSFGERAVSTSITIINFNVIISFFWKLGIKGLTIWSVKAEKPAFSITDRPHDPSVYSFHMCYIIRRLGICPLFSEKFSLFSYFLQWTQIKEPESRFLLGF